jgi:hypothetical protein
VRSEHHSQAGVSIIHKGQTVAMCHGRHASRWVSEADAEAAGKAAPKDDLTVVSAQGWRGGAVKLSDGCIFMNPRANRPQGFGTHSEFTEGGSVSAMPRGPRPQEVTADEPRPNHMALTRDLLAIVQSS